MKSFWMCVLLLSSVAGHARSESLTLHGVSLGEPERQVVSYLSKSAQKEREEEGQQVWKLNNDPEASYLMIGYDAEKRVRYVTVLAKQGGSLRCDPLGDSPAKAGNAANLTFTRQYNSEPSKMLAIAHGSDLKHLTSCSIKLVSVRGEEEEEERERRPDKK